MSDLLLSAALITRDEEGFVAACLHSLDGVVDEVVVYDTGSSDATVEIARAAGARVLEGDWHDDFALARNRALDACHGRWVLSIDADEWLEDPEHAAPTIRSRLAAMAGDVAGVAPLVVNLSGTLRAPVRPDAGFNPVRLIRRGAMRWTGRVHEIPEPTGGARACERWHDVVILHAGYLTDVWGDRDKADRNLRLAQMEDPDGAKAWFEVARAMHVAGRPQDALAAYAAAARAPDAEPLVVRSCAEKAARIRLTQGDVDGARAAAAELRAATPYTGVADVLDAEIAIAAGDPERAVALLDGVHDYQDTFVLTTAAEVAALRGLALVLSGRARAGALEAARAVRDDPGLAEAWFAVAVAADRGDPSAPALAAAEVAPSHLVPALGRVLALEDPHAERIAEALWRRHAGEPAMLAAAGLLARRLPRERAPAWAARANGSGSRPD
ncbi:MAG TPA: glycosyltransferase family 2 protein [Acidimicrobiia bacterium]|nr:glycosyltransferase family 2 protein [Acidimicrobiia bacterium]